MKRILFLLVAILATSLAAHSQMAAAKKVPRIISCSLQTEMSVQRAYAAVCDVNSYPKLSGGLITSVTNVGSSTDKITVTLNSGKKYDFTLTPNTNYNTLSFSLTSPKEYENIGFIIIVDEAGDGTKLGISASGDVSSSVRDAAKNVMEPIFNALLQGFKSLE